MEFYLLKAFIMKSCNSLDNFEFSWKVVVDIFSLTQFLCSSSIIYCCKMKNFVFIEYYFVLQWQKGRNERVAQTLRSVCVCFSFNHTVLWMCSSIFSLPSCTCAHLIWTLNLVNLFLFFFWSSEVLWVFLVLHSNC